MMNDKQLKRPATVAIETAIVIPIVLVFTLSAIDLTRYFQIKAVVEHAAYVGSIQSISNNYSSSTRNRWDADIEERVGAVLNKLPFFNASLVQVETDVQRDAAQPLFTTAITVQYIFKPLLTSTFVDSQIAVSRTITARRFR